MDKLVEKMNLDNDNEFYTPEQLAWKLLMDDIDTSKVAQLLTFREGFGTDDNPITFTYEILITIFMEMIFDLVLINHHANSDNIFVPDFDKFDINLFLPLLEENFKKINIILNISTYDVQDDMQYILDNRYCRVILRHIDKQYFIEHEIEEELNYHMILNGLNKIHYNKLTDVYAIIIIKNNLFKIQFDKF